MATTTKDRFAGTPSGSVAYRASAKRLRYFTQGHMAMEYFEQRYLAWDIEGSLTERMSGTPSSTTTDRVAA